MNIIRRCRQLSSFKRLSGAKLERREAGRWYTERDLFKIRPFYHWGFLARIYDHTILEPFAGANHIIRHLIKSGQIRDFESYDINPQDRMVGKRDTLLDFPKGHEVCITNPPWLRRQTATLQGMGRRLGYEDLYEECLYHIFKNCAWAAVVLPAGFLNTFRNQNRMTDYVLIEEASFVGTRRPFCLALFRPTPVQDTRLWIGNRYVGSLNAFKSYIPRVYDKRIKFGTKGKIGMIGYDSRTDKRIRFVPGDEIRDVVTKSRRYVVLIDGTDVSPERANRYLEEFREKTHDLMLTPFRAGLMSNGKYARQLSWTLARGILTACKQSPLFP